MLPIPPPRVSLPMSTPAPTVGRTWEQFSQEAATWSWNNLWYILGGTFVVVYAIPWSVRALNRLQQTTPVWFARNRIEKARTTAALHERIRLLLHEDVPKLLIEVERRLQLAGKKVTNRAIDDLIEEQLEDIIVGSFGKIAGLIASRHLLADIDLINDRTVAVNNAVMEVRQAIQKEINKQPTRKEIQEDVKELKKDKADPEDIQEAKEQVPREVLERIFAEINWTRIYNQADHAAHDQIQEDILRQILETNREMLGRM